MHHKLINVVSHTKHAKMPLNYCDYHILHSDGNATDDDNDDDDDDEETPLVLSYHGDTNCNYGTLTDEESLTYYGDSNCGNSINRRWIYFTNKWFIVVVVAVIAISTIVILHCFGPSIMKKVIPVMHWLIETCSPPVLAAILFAAIALLPLLILPTMPVEWIVGMAFSYGISVLLIISGVAVAASLSYFIAYHKLRHRIDKWLHNHPDKAALVRLAGDGNWLHQFQAITLLRLTPFPFAVLNYVAVATGVKYSSYIAGTLIGVLPEILLAIYSGKMFRKMAEAMEDHIHVSKLQMIFDVLLFCLSFVLAIAIGFYAKRRLKQLQEAEEQQQRDRASLRHFFLPTSTM